MDVDSIISPERIHHELLHCAAQTNRSLQKSMHMETLSRLCQSLATDRYFCQYTPSAYTRFAVTDPKLREIYAPSFRDRLLQNWLVHHMTPAVEKMLIDDTFANRKNKGVLAAVQRAQRFMRQPGHTHYLQLDIQNFFNAISQSLLLRQCEAILQRYFDADPLKRILHDLLEKSILFPVASNTYMVSGDRQRLNALPPHKTLQGAGPGRGLPLGSASSQMFANIYLNPLDQFIKHRLKVKGYVRYMDDLLLLGDTPQQLSRYRHTIRDFMKDELKLTLHPQKQSLQTCQQGADYLGYKVYPHYLHLRTRNITKLLAWLRFFNDELAGRTLTPAGYIANTPKWRQRVPLREPDYPLLQHMLSVINSYFGLMKQANHYRLRQHIYHHHFDRLKTFMRPGDAQYTAVRLKKHGLLTWIESQHPPSGR